MKPTRLEHHNNLKTAVENNDVEQVQAILHQEQHLVNRLVHDADIHYSFLYKAAEKGAVEMAQVLLEAKANVNQQCANGVTPLIAAASNGSAELVQLLLAQPEIIVDLVDDERWTPLTRAAAGSHTSIIQHLLDAKANVDSAIGTGDTGLCVAAQLGHRSTCKLLLQHKADVNHQNNVGVCSLYWAANFGYKKMAALLLAANASVDLAESGGYTPLIQAVAKGHLATVKLCLAAGADVNHRTAKLRAALHFACDFGIVEVVDELLRAGADTSTMHEEDWTPLMLSAHHGRCVHCIAAQGQRRHQCGRQSRPHAAVARSRPRPRRGNKTIVGQRADWLKKADESARQLARGKTLEVKSLFECALCGWTGMCCAACRKKYCAIDCDKFSGQLQIRAAVNTSHCCIVDRRNKELQSTVDCRLHRKMAHQSVLEWALSVSSLQLPPYVVEHIFNCLDLHHTDQSGDYQSKIAEKRIATVQLAHPPLNVNENFIHLIVEERTHQENIKLFISVQQAYRKSEVFAHTL